MEAVATLVNGVGESVLYTCLERERRRDPAASDEDLLRCAARTLVPASVVGSPAYHRSKLHDLLAIVDRHGIPNLFLTLTADEVSELRWPEVGQMEALLNDTAGDGGFTWRDMPVEMARLFSDRVNAFMQEHILASESPMLGRVTHWAVRYEAQVRAAVTDSGAGVVGRGCMLCGASLRHMQARMNAAVYVVPPPYQATSAHAARRTPAPRPSQYRGSLHAHIMLWVDADDLPRVKQEITATRCKYKLEVMPDGSTRHVPDLPEGDCAARRLFYLVERKQVHVCRTSKGGCRHQRPTCGLNFPFDINLEGTVFHEATKRWAVDLHLDMRWGHAACAAGGCDACVLGMLHGAATLLVGKRVYCVDHACHAGRPVGKRL